MRSLSIIIPCFNEEEVLPLTYAKLSEVCLRLQRDYEIIFIDDGSKDKTYDIIQSFSLKDKHIGGISLSRNFGKEGVLKAGLEAAKGELVAVMDADLQDPPELLEEMIRLIEDNGYDQVGTYRKSRSSQSFLTRFFSESYYRSFNAFSDTKVHPNEREYRMMNRKVVNAILSLKENTRYIKNIWTWVGFKTIHIGYDDIDRAAGKTKYNIKNKFKLAFRNIFSSSTKPLAVIYQLTGFVSIISILYFLGNVAIYVLYKSNYFWSMNVALLLIFLNVQLVIFSLIAIYLNTIYHEVKQRPSFLIDHTFSSSLKGENRK